MEWLPTTSGQIPQTSVSIYLLNLEPHIVMTQTMKSNISRAWCVRVSHDTPWFQPV